MVTPWSARQAGGVMLETASGDLRRAARALTVPCYVILIAPGPENSRNRPYVIDLLISTGGLDHRHNSAEDGLYQKFTSHNNDIKSIETPPLRVQNVSGTPLAGHSREVGFQRL